MLLLDAVAALLAPHYPDVSTKRLDRFTGREGVVVRPMPAVTVDEFYDGKRIVRLYFQVFVRRRDEDEARRVCDGVARLLDGACLDPDEGTAQGSVEVYAWPQELELDEKAFTSWEARFSLDVLMS